MTLIDTIQNSDQTRVKDIKTVKNASIFSANDIIYCKHYDTVIFAYDMKNKVCEIMGNLSTTSNRQITHLFRAFPELSWISPIVTDLNKDEKLHDKWSFSGELT